MLKATHSKFDRFDDNLTRDAREWLRDLNNNYGMYFRYLTILILGFVLVLPTQAIKAEEPNDLFTLESSKIPNTSFQHESLEISIQLKIESLQKLTGISYETLRDHIVYITPKLVRLDPTSSREPSNYECYTTKSTGLTRQNSTKRFPVLQLAPNPTITMTCYTSKGMSRGKYGLWVNLRFASASGREILLAGNTKSASICLFGKEYETQCNYSDNLTRNFDGTILTVKSNERVESQSFLPQQLSSFYSMLQESEQNYKEYINFSSEYEILLSRMRQELSIFWESLENNKISLSIYSNSKNYSYFKKLQQELSRQISSTISRMDSEVSSERSLSRYERFISSLDFDTEGDLKILAVEYPSREFKSISKNPYIRIKFQGTQIPGYVQTYGGGVYARLLIPGEKLPTKGYADTFALIESLNFVDGQYTGNILIGPIPDGFFWINTESETRPSSHCLGMNSVSRFSLVEPFTSVYNLSYYEERGEKYVTCPNFESTYYSELKAKDFESLVTAYTLLAQNETSFGAGRKVSEGSKQVFSELIQADISLGKIMSEFEGVLSKMKTNVSKFWCVKKSLKIKPKSSKTKVVYCPNNYSLTIL